MICFYANRGNYHLHFINKGATPKVIDENVRLEANKAYFYGLSEKTIDPQKSKIQFSQLPTNVGKNYLDWYRRHQALPDHCPDISTLPSRPAKLYYVMKIRNESNIPYQVSLNEIGTLLISPLTQKNQILSKK